MTLEDKITYLFWGTAVLGAIAITVLVILR